MTIQRLDDLDPEGSVLFLGSGFSVGAKNIAGNRLPAGNALRKIFADLIGVDPESYDLQTLADEIANRPEYNLYQVLYEIFTVQSLSSDQLDILELPWMRIYTTNYDDVVEYALLKHKSRISSYSYDEKKPRKLLPTSVVHLHGAIRQTTEDNVCEQLVLNEHSYVRQHFERSPWYDEFVRDIRYSTNCFFIGYSLSDYHISALLFQEEYLRSKTIFITREADVIFQNRVEKYGSVLPIGTNGFSNLCTSLPRRNRLENPFSLKSLRYIDPFKDKKTLAPPTSIEVLNLVTYGAFNEQRGMASLPSVAS